MRFFEKSDTPRVKVCGLKSLENARDVISAGADAIGINFWPKSKRFIAPGAAAEWLGELAGQVCRIGLFVNATIDEIETVIDHCVLDAIQLHGQESPDFCDEAAAFGLPIIKAIGVKDESFVHDPGEYSGLHLLLDAFDPQAFGGTGQSFQWSVARDFVAQNPDRLVILAGGLDPDNVAKAVREVSPHAVDVASGVESSPGVKDPEMVERFVAAAQRAKNESS